MKPPHPQLRTSAFTLAELVLALGMASVFLVGIFSVLSAGLNASGEANTDTRVSLILRDVSDRMRGKPIAEDAAPLAPQYYDVDGRWLDQEDASQSKQNNYKVTVKIAKPVNVRDHTNVLSVVVHIYWPVERVSNGTQIPVTAAPKATFSYLVSSRSGQGWKKLDPDYLPKIEG